MSFDCGEWISLLYKILAFTTASTFTFLFQVNPIKLPITIKVGKIINARFLKIKEICNLCLWKMSCCKYEVFAIEHVLFFFFLKNYPEKREFDYIDIIGHSWAPLCLTLHKQIKPNCYSQTGEQQRREEERMHSETCVSSIFTAYFKGT